MTVQMKVRVTRSDEAVRRLTIQAGGAEVPKNLTTYVDLTEEVRQQYPDLVTHLVDLAESPINSVSRTSSELFDVNFAEVDGAGLYVRVYRLPVVPEVVWFDEQVAQRKPPTAVGRGHANQYGDFVDGLLVPGSKDFAVGTFDGDDVLEFVAPILKTLHGFIPRATVALETDAKNYNEAFSVYERDMSARIKQLCEQRNAAAERAKAKAEADAAEEKARKAAAAAKATKERLDWIREHGSDRLKAMVEDGYPCKELYRLERAVYVLAPYMIGGTVVAVVSAADAKNLLKQRTCPTELGYAAERWVRGGLQSAGHIQDGKRQVRSMWLNYPNDIAGITSNGESVSTVLQQRRAMDTAANGADPLRHELASTNEVLVVYDVLPGYVVLLVLDADAGARAFRDGSLGN